MKCPTCLENFNVSQDIVTLYNNYQAPLDPLMSRHSVRTMSCPSLTCRQRIIFLDTEITPDNLGVPSEFADPPYKVSRMVLPRSEARPNVTLSDIPKKYSEDYIEAVEVLPASAKSSAALSRRLLQTMLRDESSVKHSDLNAEIGEVIDGKMFSSRILAKLDIVRVIGNFAVHPIKSVSTGEIVEVEPGEAELNLDVVEMLFDEYFTAPRLDAERTRMIDEKLTAAGKPTIDQSIKDRQVRIDKQKNKKSL